VVEIVVGEESCEEEEAAVEVLRFLPEYSFSFFLVRSSVGLPLGIVLWIVAGLLWPLPEPLVV
jgi:hypothetical protein